MKSVIKKINYPQQLLEKRIGGIVYAGFTIDTLGKIKNVHINYGATPLMDEEVIRVISSLPNFAPALLDGMSGEVEMKLSISFNLAEPYNAFIDNKPLSIKGLEAIKFGDYETAMSYYKKAYHLEKESLDVIFNLALLYNKVGKKKKACKLWKRAIALGDEESKELLIKYCN